MATRKSQQSSTPPSLSPERAQAAITKQLKALQDLRGKSHIQADSQEREWAQLTQSIVERAFGIPSSNLTHFFTARSAGEYYITPWGDQMDQNLDQRNFEARINACEAFLNSTLAELELIMPERELQGHYDVGDEYGFYRDVKAILANASSDVMIVDPYLSTEIFDVYADGINKTVNLRLLTNNLPGAVLTVGTKYVSSGGRVEIRSSTTTHDRLILIDDRVWYIGQSIKDAARKKPTYIVEQDGSIVRPIYENIWNTATKII